MRDDSRDRSSDTSRSGRTPEQIKDVKRTYDRIAQHFAQTRQSAWEPVEKFVNSSHGSIGVDIGCGNGRHAELLTNRTERVIGIDLSREVLRQARQRAERNAFQLALIQAEATTLPLPSARIDLIVYIATIHHIPSRTGRVESLNEISRVLSADGRALVSAWSVTHEKFSRDRAFDTTITWTLPSGETVDRYYHIYDIDEFRHDLDSSSLSVKRVFEEAGNCYGVVGPSEQ